MKKTEMKSALPPNKRAQCKNQTEGVKAPRRFRDASLSHPVRFARVIKVGSSNIESWEIVSDQQIGTEADDASLYGMLGWWCGGRKQKLT